MINLRQFKQKLSTISRLWERKNYDAALAEVDAALKLWPGNAHLHVLWARLVQLQENSKNDLAEVKQALRQAVQLDTASPAAAIELGHFLDNVEDDPQAASTAFGEGVAAARQLLIEGLIGQAKAFRQLNKRKECLRCLLQILHLAQFEIGSKKTKGNQHRADVIFESPVGQFHAVQLNGPYAEQIEELLSEVIMKRSA